jgi:pilus assembly protein CpaE
MAHASVDEIRLLLVEDVPQVAQYIRNLLTAQTAIKLLDVVTDGTKAVRQVEQLRPDIVLVDSLLQGRLKGMALVDQLRRLDLVVPVIVLTVPQNPIEAAPGRGVHGVLSMPFSGFDLSNKVNAVYTEFHQTDTERVGRIVSVFAPKGGVGKTTIALNFAVAASQAGQRTVLIDGSLQFGDLRALLQVPVDAPSILELPTDRIQEQDLRDVLWRDPSGVDILLAPPRVEQHEMVTPRDIQKVLSLLRRVYRVIVVDLPSALTEQTLEFLDQSDQILEIVTYDSTTLRNTAAIAETFRQIGYPPDKVAYVLNRADSAGGLTIDDVRRTLGRQPDHAVVSDGMLVIQSNNQGVPFVLANPAAAISQDMSRMVGTVLGLEPARVGRW